MRTQKKPSSRHTNARCPVCHKKMDLVGKGDGQRFVCVCGHKEKLSSFEERKKKEGKGASKKDVNHYLRKQAKEAKEPINTAFAEAFSEDTVIGSALANEVDIQLGRRPHEVATRGGVYSVKRLILFYLYSIFNGRNDLQSEFHNSISKYRQSPID